MPAKKPLSDKRTIDQLAKMFNLPAYDDVVEHNWEIVADAGNGAYARALADGDTENQAEKAREKAEMAQGDEIYHQWYDAVEHTASAFFERHGLELAPVSSGGKRSNELRIIPKTAWIDAAARIRITAEGVGFAYVGNDVNEFLKMGPYTPRQAVLEHIGVIADYPEVFGGSSAMSIYSRAFS
jgi:hypothetical protein